MRTNSARAAMGVGLIVLAVALFLVLQGGDDNSTEPREASTPPAEENTDGRNGQDPQPPREVPPPIPTVVVRNGEPVGGVQSLEFTQGETAKFRVRSDVADEIHLHGYDISKPIAAGETVAFSFKADIDGVYEAELEGIALPIAEISVKPE